MSPACESGCGARPDHDPFHYFYHVKSAEVVFEEEGWPDGFLKAERHRAAYQWLHLHDLDGEDPMKLAAKAYSIPDGATVLPVQKSPLDNP